MAKNALSLAALLLAAAPAAAAVPASMPASLPVSLSASGAMRAPPAIAHSLVSPAGATRSAGGATAIATISARIIRASASVGDGRAAPAPNMVPRATTVTAADGRVVPALVYDFE